MWLALRPLEMAVLYELASNRSPLLAAPLPLPPAAEGIFLVDAASGEARRLANGSRATPSAPEAMTGEPAAPAEMPAISLGRGLPESLREARDVFEAVFIRHMLERCDGSATRAAQRMGISRASIHAKLKEHRIR